MGSAHDLANLYADLSNSVDSFRLSQQPTLSPDEFAAIGNTASNLLHISNQFLSAAISATLANVQVDVDNIIAITQAAQNALKTIQNVQKVVSIATAAVTLGLAIVSGNVGSIASGVGGLATAVGSGAMPAPAGGEAQGAALTAPSAPSSAKMSIEHVIASRIKTAWDKLSQDPTKQQVQQQIAAAMMQGNEQAVSVVQTGKAPSAAYPPYQVLAYSALSGDEDQVVNKLRAGVVLDVGPDGVIWVPVNTGRDGCRHSAIR
jgi:hypothetical protein